MSINELIMNYNRAKETENAAKKEKETLKQLILNYANGRELFDTEEYTVIITKRPQNRIDTEKLYKDFPDFKDVYGKTTVSEIITAKEKQTQKKTA